MLSNMQEWEKIQTMNKVQLVEYYSHQDYLKRYVNGKTKTKNKN